MNDLLKQGNQGETTTDKSKRYMLCRAYFSILQKDE